MVQRTERWMLAAALAVVLGGCGKSSGSPDAGVAGTVIGQTSVDIDGRMVVVRTNESALGDYLVDDLLAEVKKAGKSADVAVLNGGAIRGGAFDPMTHQPVSNDARLGKLYPKGPLTDLDVAGWQPFANDTNLVSMTGRQLKSVLERGASQLPPDLRNDQGGPFLHVAGMQYTIDCAGTPQTLTTDGKAVDVEGTRVVKIQVGSSVIYDAANSVDMLDATTLTVAANSFIAAGLDGHIAFTKGTTTATLTYATFNPTTQVTNLIKATTPISPKTDGRITIKGACGVPGTTP